MAAVVKVLTIAAAVTLLPVAAAAQGGPSFDCAKASNAVERVICKDVDLAKADRDLSQLYAALLGRLTGPAKESLQKGQVAWVVNRNRGCVGGDPDSMSICLKRRYDQRIADLRASSRGPYPFVEAQWIARKGKVGKTGYAIDIGYPRFAGTTANFSEVNKAYADAAADGAKEATPTADASGDLDQQWSAEGGYALFRPGTNAITVQSSFWSHTGGAHGYGSTTCALVDLRSGRFVSPDEVFVAGDGWHKRVLTIATENLKWQFEANPGFEDALQPAKLGKMLREGDRYCWREAHLEIYFNQYEVGPYSAGPYSVNMSYDSIRSLLRAGGPIGN